MRKLGRSRRQCCPHTQPWLEDMAGQWGVLEAPGPVKHQGHFTSMMVPALASQPNSHSDYHLLPAVQQKWAATPLPDLEQSVAVWP